MNPTGKSSVIIGQRQPLAPISQTVHTDNVSQKAQGVLTQTHSSSSSTTKFQTATIKTAQMSQSEKTSELQKWQQLEQSEKQLADVQKQKNELAAAYKASQEREKASQEEEKASLEREKASLEREKASQEREKAAQEEEKASQEREKALTKEKEASLERSAGLQIEKLQAFASIFGITPDAKLQEEYLQNRHLLLIPKDNKNWPVINDMTPIIQYLKTHDVSLLNFKEFASVKGLETLAAYHANMQKSGHAFDAKFRDKKTHEAYQAALQKALVA